MAKVKRLLPLLLACVAVPCAAYTLNISGPNSAVKGGQTVTLVVSLGSSAGQNIAALQGSIANPGGIITCQPGAAAQVAGKQVACAVVGGVLTFIVWGLNASLLSDGALVNISLTLPVPGQSGDITEALSGLYGADIDGGSVSGVAGPPFVLNVASGCDVDSSGGAVNAGDVAVVVNNILNRAAPVIDLDGDTRTTAVELQRVINAALGRGCRE